MTRIIVDTYEYGDPRIKEASERMNRLIQEAAMRRGRRIHRAIEIAARPGWIDADPPTFVFPGWGPKWRPFDFEVDA